MTVEFDTESIVGRVQQAAFSAVVEATEATLANAVRRIQEPPKTGHIYRRRGVEHQASAPGESPAADTGRLVQSGRTESNSSTLTGRVIFTTAYAAALEYGNDKGTIAPRPYARPALAEEQINFVNNLRSEIRRALST